MAGRITIGTDSGEMRARNLDVRHLVTLGLEEPFLVDSRDVASYLVASEESGTTIT